MSKSTKLARILKVLSVGTRLEVLRLLKSRVLCVNALAARLNVTQGAVSQHLRIMRDAGLVVDEKRGYFVHYRLNEKTLAVWRAEIDKLLAPEPAASPNVKGTSNALLQRPKEELPEAGEPEGQARKLHAAAGPRVPRRGNQASVRDRAGEATS